MKLIQLSENLEFPKNGIMFQTSRGSYYTWDPQGKCSTRSKAFHPEHGASSSTGIQKPSDKTLFIASESGLEFADATDWVHSKKFLFYTRGNKLFLYSASDNSWGDPITFSWTPRPGLYPIEVWGIQKNPEGYRSARSVHLGNEIIKVSDAPF